jgi:hypothetical protein
MDRINELGGDNSQQTSAAAEDSAHNGSGGSVSEQSSFSERQDTNQGVPLTCKDLTGAPRQTEGGAVMIPESKLNSEVTGNTDAETANPPGNVDEHGLTDARDSRPTGVEISGSRAEPDKRTNSRLVVRKATGPRTAAGKEKSKRNALKLGIFAKEALLPDESRAEFNSLWRGLRKALTPVKTFEETLVEKLTVNLWMQRRVLIGEVAGIEEVRRGYAFRRDDHEPTSKTVHLLVHYEGQEDHSALMETRPARKLPAIDRCLQLLRDLATGIQSSGFDSNRDSAILIKLYGSLSDDNHEKLLFKSYQTWQSATNRSEEERLRKGSASPQECVDHFVKDVEGEIRRLESQKGVDLDRVELQRLRQVVPDCQQSDYLLHRLIGLERSFDRLMTLLERRQRIRLGHSVPPQIEVHHSVSHD